ncbi:MAG: hypothetical protein ACHQJ6_00050 [Candidatus Berkiellales bacterium]
MAITNTTDDGDDQLKDILISIHNYLYVAKSSNNSLLLAITKPDYYKVCRSWDVISHLLDNFTNHPSENYTKLIVAIEGELPKFADDSFYSRQLKALHQLVRTGPKISPNVHHP